MISLMSYKNMISMFTKNVISPLYLWKIPERIQHTMDIIFPSAS